VTLPRRRDRHKNSALSVDDRRVITELLYRYAELMDRGDLDGAAALFTHARVRVASGDHGIIDGDGLREIWESTVILYADGTPRTSHVISNPIVELDPDGTSATARSVYTVFQVVGGSLQAIVAGRYHDRLARVDDGWRFTERDYTLVDLVGDVSGHLRIELGEHA